MNATPTVVRDERTVAVENAGYKWAYGFLTYALLIDVVYRGLVRGEAAWDLLAMVIVGGFVCTAYQVRHRTMAGVWTKEFAFVLLIVGITGAIVAAVIAAVQAG